LDSLLGVGGMAWVYAATHRNKNRVAIKLLAPHLSHSPDIQRRFLREGYAANSIEHPSAVKVFDDDVSDDGLAFLVMELLEGKTLAELRRESGGRVDPQRVLRYSAQVLDVLAAAHDHNVVHRDIKPSNVFLTADDNVKVVDFGIARVCEGGQDLESTQTGMLLGSAPFMSPEQARGRWELVDPRTDIWSMGATMFQLLAGRAVHEASTPQERLMAAMTERARSLASVVPSMPPAVVELVDRALAFEREARWQTAREMMERTREVAKRLGSLGSTLMIDAPPPEISSPMSSPAPVSPPAPSAKNALGSTVVMGSNPSLPLEPPTIPKPKDLLARTHVYGSPGSAARLPPVPAPASLGAQPSVDPQPPAPSPASPFPSVPVIQVSSPRPRPVAIPVPDPSDAGTAAASSLARDPARPPRRSPVLLAGVIAFVAGAALLTVTAIALWKIRTESAAPRSAADTPANIASESTRAPAAALPASERTGEPADAGSVAKDASADVEQE
jgi:serine/threonine protein kinase